MSEKKRLFLSPPHMGGEELNYVKQAFESNYIAPLGPMVDAFEEAIKEKTGFTNAVALASGTAGLHLALRNLGVGPADEVFASTLTFIGSVSPIVFQRARPVFIDSDLQTWTLDPELLAQELHCCQKRGRLPKAVIPTDLYGQCADIDKILAICDSYGVAVISDSAESLGALYQGRHAGLGAKAAVFSFNGNKIITTSGGGMLVSDEARFIEKARFLSQQARDNAPHYQHSQIGYNYRMSNIAAAIGLGQLECLDQRIARKREIFRYYKSALDDLPGISFMPEARYGRSNYWLTVMLVNPAKFGADTHTIRLALEEHNIESRPVWKPMHLQPVFSIIEDETKHHHTTLEKCPARAVGGHVAEALFKNGLCLPSGTALSERQLESIVMRIRRLHGVN
ncbi:MAG: aminotransferase DegT [Desulfobacteraceae bacterium]|nr:aminotransferase DegT [Desulfobacteraceae bacterium]